MMLRLPLIAGLALLAMRAVGQYPLTRTVDLRGPLRETQVRQLAQDEQDLLWVAHEKGLTCSDGRRAVQVFDAGTDRVMLMSEAAPVLAFLRSGILLRCAHQQVDTLWTDTSFRRTPPRAMRTAADGTLWIGTYGGGLVLRKGERSRSIRIGEGLSDDHVNALAPLAGGRMAVATDQGIDVLDAAGVLQHHFTEEQGLPDNLVLSLAVDPSGMLWAGTHHGGIFRLDAADPQAAPVRYGCADAMGPIRSLRWASDRIWAGTEEHGVLVCDAQDAAGDRYSEAWARGAITAITVIADGSVWWCSGKSTVTRAFAEAELFTEHEGVDLRRATALCITPDRRICVATRQGLLLHPIAFQPEQRLKFLPLPIQPDRPILALEATADGSLWAGTFGDGVFRIEPDGKVRHYTEAQQLCNANVMAMDASGDRNAPVWFATLGGVCLFDPARNAFRTVAIPGTRFVYDVQVLADGTALLATDGNGVVRVDPDGSTSVLGPAEMQRASFYSLCVDHQGTAWACGPGTGLCAVEGNSLRKRAELSGDVFGIQPYTDGVVAFGRDATPFFNAQRGNALDWAAFFDLEGLQAELNAMVADAGSLWVATDRGLLRLHPDPARLEQGPAVVVTRWTGGNEHLDPDSAQVLAYDHNDIELRFAAPYYALTGGDLRFEYRLPGSDTTLRTTTDDRLFWPRLPAGDHRFAIRAVVARGTVQGPWTELRFRIQLPWWRTP
ncbi:MAG TPA: two-component regulator propeller domain-containing protein, partial [Flavobacteriales bacterium]